MKTPLLSTMITLAFLVGCGSDSDDDATEDLTALCTEETTSVVDADEVLTEITYSQVPETSSQNDNSINAQQLSKNTIVTGSLERTVTTCPDCYDYYSLPVNEGDELEISLEGDNGTDFDLILYNRDDNDSYIDQSIEGINAEKLIYTVSPGISNLTIEAQTNIANSGNYTLTVTSYSDASPIEPSTSELNGKITDASTGNALNGASINLRACGETSGEILVSDTSDSVGQYNVDIETGTYTIEVALDGYTSEFTTVELTADEDSIKNFPLNEQLAEGETRIVLSWGPSPSDLDSHLEVPKATSGTTEIYYRNRAEENVSLDVDDAGGFGPETITVSSKNSGTYKYWVQDYSNRGNSSSTALGNSEAVVKVYNANGLANTFKVPVGSGQKWNVFTMDGDTGEVTSVNTLE